MPISAQNSAAQTASAAKTNRTARANRAVRRLSLPLTAQDEADLALLRREPAALLALGVEPTASEAALLHAIHLAGIRAIMDRIAATGYAELADQLRDEMTADEIAVRKDRRRRQVTRDSPIP